MNAFPYFKVHQFSNEFIVTKMNSKDLIERVDFEFRFPYQDSEKDVQNAYKYIDKLKGKTHISISQRENGIQRRTDLSRVESIADYIHDHGKSFLIFTTPLVLGVNLYSEDRNSEINSGEQGTLYFEKEPVFTVIDGQHRLLGIARYAQKYGNDITKIELPIILLKDIDLQGATKVFIDINANQRKVNRSVVFDLYDNIDDEKYNRVKNIKAVVQALNENETSVLHKKIKMLGAGEGSISLAFMIDYIYGEVLKKNINFDRVILLKRLNNYLSVFKSVYENDWNNYLTKTTGMGALLMYYPIAEELFGDFLNKESLIKLKNHLETKYIDFTTINGTGKKAQKYLLNLFE